VCQPSACPGPCLGRGGGCRLLTERQSGFEWDSFLCGLFFFFLIFLDAFSTGVKGPVGWGTDGCFRAASAPRGLQALVEGGVCCWPRGWPSASRERGPGLAGAKESGASRGTAHVSWARSSHVSCVLGLKYMRTQGGGFIASWWVSV